MRHAFVAELVALAHVGDGNPVERQSLQVGQLGLGQCAVVGEVQDFAFRQLDLLAAKRTARIDTFGDGAG